MDVELRHLRALVTIAAEGTVTAAAVRLRITQPALSRTLHQLEQRVGAVLVDRSTRHLALTPTGRPSKTQRWRDSASTFRRHSSFAATGQRK